MTAIEEMLDSQWDLTLFTCTLGGESRVALRCKRMDEKESLSYFANASFPSACSVAR